MRDLRAGHRAEEIDRNRPLIRRTVRKRIFKRIPLILHCIAVTVLDRNDERIVDIPDRKRTGRRFPAALVLPFQVHSTLLPCVDHVIIAPCQNDFSAHKTKIGKMIFRIESILMCADDLLDPGLDLCGIVFFIFRLDRHDDRLRRVRVKELQDILDDRREPDLFRERIRGGPAFPEIVKKNELVPLQTDANIKIAAADEELVTDRQILIAEKIGRIAESGSARMRARYVDAGDRSSVIDRTHPVREGSVALRRCVGSESSFHHRKSTYENEDQHHKHYINDSFFFHKCSFRPEFIPNRSIPGRRPIKREV